jgi:hypothetical protein
MTVDQLKTQIQQKLKHQKGKQKLLYEGKEMSVSIFICYKDESWNEVYQWSISTLVFFELFRQDSFIELNGRGLFRNNIIAARMWTTAFIVNIFN